MRKKITLYLTFLASLFISTNAFCDDTEALDTILKCQLPCKGSTSPGGECYAGPGGSLYAGPGGACYAGPGGPLYAGPGGNCYTGPSGPCSNSNASSECPLYCFDLCLELEDN